MKRTLVSILVCVILLLNVLIAGTAQAQPNLLAVTATQQSEDVIKQIETKILPEVESILTPEQFNQIDAAMAEGKTSLRKAFKSLSLTSEQKTKLADVFKSLPKKDAFASLTPEQKKATLHEEKEFFQANSRRNC